jgi:hypothetical protein
MVAKKQAFKALQGSTQNNTDWGSNASSTLLRTTPRYIICSHEKSGSDISMRALTF